MGVLAKKLWPGPKTLLFASSVLDPKLSLKQRRKTMLRKTIKMFATVVFLVTAAVILAPNAMAQAKCNLETIKGSYGFYYTSGIPGSPSYGIGVGVVSFDGAGKGTSTETVSLSGTILEATSSATYTVNEDCTGTISWTYPDFGGLVVNGRIVITDNGKSIITIGTDAGSLSYGIYTKQ